VLGHSLLQRVDALHPKWARARQFTCLSQTSPRRRKFRVMRETRREKFRRVRIFPQAGSRAASRDGAIDPDAPKRAGVTVALSEVSALRVYLRISTRPRGPFTSTARGCLRSAPARLRRGNATKCAPAALPRHVTNDLRFCRHASTSCFCASALGNLCAAVAAGCGKPDNRRTIAREEL
jgi:hypothetical protein